MNTLALPCVNESARNRRGPTCNSTKADRAETNLRDDVNAVLMIIKLSFPSSQPPTTTLQTRFSPPLSSPQTADFAMSLGNKNWQTIFNNAVQYSRSISGLGCRPKTFHSTWRRLVARASSSKAEFCNVPKSEQYSPEIVPKDPSNTVVQYDLDPNS